MGGSRARVRFFFGGLGMMIQRIFGGGLLMLVFGGVLLALPIVKALQIKRNRPQFDQKLKVWQSTWVCLRCGALFVP